MKEYHDLIVDAKERVKITFLKDGRVYYIKVRQSLKAKKYTREVVLSLNKVLNFMKKSNLDSEKLKKSPMVVKKETLELIVDSGSGEYEKLQEFIHENKIAII